MARSFIPFSSFQPPFHSPKQYQYTDDNKGISKNDQNKTAQILTSFFSMIGENLALLLLKKYFKITNVLILV